MVISSYSQANCSSPRLPAFALFFLFALPACPQTASQIAAWLGEPLLDPRQPLLEAQVYTASRVPPMPVPASAAEWDRTRDQLRERILREVVLRGEARNWRGPERRIEWREVLEGPGYRVKKLRFEAIPGLWIPAVLYEPAQFSGKVPVVLNVNGHERQGITTNYIQVRCINLAKRGMLAMNAEWLGKGQLDVPGLNHYRMPQVDLTGTSGVAAFYLEMERSLDILLAHPNADPKRVAVTGLSGGGWQTTMITALDPRITVSIPVAGHSSFVTRAQWPTLDLGDSEQTPSDLAAAADYLHLSAMTAPRPLLLINNAKDNCCFRADYALGPLVQATRGIYGLYGRGDRLRYYINHSDGHNYDRFSREELYRFLRDEFYPGNSSYAEEEIPSDAELRTAEQLASPLPAGSLTFQTLALRLAENLPKPGGTREKLAAVVRSQTLPVDARAAKRSGGVTWWQLRMGGSWTVPAVDLGPPSASQVVLLLSDEGRPAVAAEAARLVAEGKRVLVMDPFLLGESKIVTRGFLFAMLLAGLGERPLGLQASQIAAAARWLACCGQSVTVQASGRRTGLAALVAAALEPKIERTRIQGGLRSLRQILEENLMVDAVPEFFCFGLLEQFDVPQIAALGRNVEWQ